MDKFKCYTDTRQVYKGIKHLAHFGFSVQAIPVIFVRKKERGLLELPKTPHPRDVMALDGMDT